jgi:NitT/TauT family transport system permease protein
MINLRKLSEFIFAIGLLIVVWFAYIILFKVPAYVLPLPLDVAKAFWDLLIYDKVLYHFSITFSEVIIGFILGSLLGFIMGYLIAKVRILEKALMPYILMAQTAPKIALAPLFVIWFGLGLFSKLILIISMVFFPVMLGTIFGLKGISYNLKCLMKITGLTWWQRITQVEFPHSLPFIFSGLKVGVIQANIAAIVAEWISGQSGLGFLLTYNSTTYNSNGLFATIIYTMILGMIFYQVINLLEKKLLFWHESKQM